jgi:hypothetical protein
VFDVDLYQQRDFGLDPGGPPGDMRAVYFQHPDDRIWHTVAWEHAPALGTPFISEALTYARRLAAHATLALHPTNSGKS